MDTDRNALAASSPGLSVQGPAGRVPPPRTPGQGHPSSCALRPMAAEDLAFVVDEHLVHFPDGFFARLGRPYLTAYTRTYLTSRHARAYVAESDGVAVGFLVGVTDPVAHRRHVLDEHGRGLALRACAALSVRPRLTLHFVRTRLGRYARKLLPRVREPRPAPAPGISGAGVSAVLAHVVVSTHIRSYGLGSALVQHFVQDAEAAGCARVCLVTTAGPGGAGRYYERLGWLRTDEHRTPEGRLMLTYEFPLRHRQRGTAP